MPTTYVLVDFENVQPDLSALAGTSFKVKLFVGAKQQEQRHRYSFLKAVMALGGNAELIEITRSGSNAVDMHIAWYIGGLLEREPGAHVHIVSGDSDFDPLLEFLAARGVSCRRTKTLTELVVAKTPGRAASTRAAKGRAPAARPAPARASPASAPAPAPAPVKSPASDKLSGVLKHLRSMKDKPTTRTRLVKWIDTHFRQHGGVQSPKTVERTLDELVRLRFVTLDGTKVAYHLTS
jgi:PIN domain